jgi:RND family efflux transporter MFP subunit
MTRISAASRGILLCGLLIASFIPVFAAEEPGLDTRIVERREVVYERLLEGVVEAVNQSTVSAQTSGRVAEIIFDVDDYVEAGKIILRFHDTEQRAAVAGAEAQLREAEARHIQAQEDFARIEQLFASRTVPRARFDQSKADLDAAKARIEAASAALDRAREQLDYTTVRAPYSGVVTRRHVELGELANVGQALMSGLSLDELRVVVDVPQEMVNPVRERRRATVVHPTGDERRITVENMTIFPYAAAASNTFTVRLLLPPKTEGLFPGMLVKASFEIGTVDRLTVPGEAIAYRGEVAGVYVVTEDGSIALRQVRPGRAGADGEIQILAGLAPGERVALDAIAAAVRLKEAAAGQ